jgi:hypothetical protein
MSTTTNKYAKIQVNGVYPGRSWSNQSEWGWTQINHLIKAFISSGLCIPSFEAIYLAKLMI